MAVASRLEIGSEGLGPRESVAPGAHGTGRERLRDRGAKGPRSDREELGTMVADGVPDPARRHPTTDPARFFEQDRPAARLGELGGGSEPTDSGTDDDTINGVVHDADGLGAGCGKSEPSRSLVQGTRLDASSSPLPQPAIAPITSAEARTRAKTCAFSGGNCVR